MVLQSAPVTCQGCEVGRREVPGQVRGKGVKKYYSKFDLPFWLNWCSQLSLEPNRATNRKVYAVQIS